jgi:hypothetical protein
MSDIPDYELLKTEEPPELEPQGTRRGVWIATGLCIGAGALAAYLIYGRRPPALAPAKAVQVSEQPVRPLGSDAELIDVPPLPESDPVVRELVRKITSHPRALAWLATNGLIRNFTLVVSNVVDGTTPANHLRVLRPSSPFQVVERNGQLFIDSRSYERYDGIAAAAASIDPEGASRVYGTLKPRIEEAYGELGLQPASFDRALERAIVVLLQTPVLDGPVRVEPKGIGYRYADPDLERLTPPQKQLLRTGPRNVRVIQSALRQLALALGIPSDRLPATSGVVRPSESRRQG